MLYDLRPDVIVETERVLDEDEVADARAALDAGEKPAKVAADLGGEIHRPSEPKASSHVTVDWGKLVEALGEEQARELVLDSGPGVARGGTVDG